jgi:uncharacterized membrane protein YeaQ/YmgE (transglycosylase-associated protein family)
MHEFLWTLLMGIIIGWAAHSIILQVAYRRGIVEYKGTKR